jgi:hypothetical protein
MSNYGTVQQRKRGRPKTKREESVGETGAQKDVGDQTPEVLTDVSPVLWTPLDPSTRAMRIEGLGCVLWVANAVCFVPDVRVKNGKLVKDSNDPELPVSASQPGWPQELHNADGKWYWRILDGNPDLSQNARYVRMNSVPGTRAAYDGEFHYLPKDNQQYGTVEFDWLASENLPDNATWPR